MQILLPAEMARDMSDKDILKMELEQLQVEVNTPRTAVSYLRVKYKDRQNCFADQIKDNEIKRFMIYDLYVSFEAIRGFVGAEWTVQINSNTH